MAVVDSSGRRPPSVCKRIVAGDAPGAKQGVIGLAAADFVGQGLFNPIDDVAAAGKWADVALDFEGLVQERSAEGVRDMGSVARRRASSSWPTRRG